MVVFLITVATHICTSYELKWFCTTLFHYGHLMFKMKTHCGLKFHFGQIYRSEICIEVSFTLLELVWTLIIKLSYIEVKTCTENCFHFLKPLHNGKLPITERNYSNIKDATLLKSLSALWIFVLEYSRNLDIFS